MTRYVRLIDPSDAMRTASRVYDLADGSLIDYQPTGKLGGVEVWSAEALLCAIESLCECGKLVYISGCPDKWNEKDPEPLQEDRSEKDCLWED